MEIFLDRLSECQTNENAIRLEREALLKRQEQELINIDQRIVNIATQRNSILEDFKNFLETTPSESNVSPSPTKQRPQSFHYVPPYTPELSNENIDPNINARNGNESSSNFHLQVDRPSSSRESTPLSQYHSPLASPLPEIKAPIPPTPPSIESPEGLLSVVENRRIIRSPIRRQNAETQLPKLSDVKISPKIATDLKLSTTKPKKLVSQKVLNSPATEKIETILDQVKHAHPLEEAAVNHCIDLLSSKCDVPSLALTDLTTSVISNGNQKKEPEIDQLQQRSTPIRRNAMKKRVETPEERRKRIEAVLFGPSPEEKKKQEMSHSSSNINELGRTQSAILDRPHAGAYCGRRSSGNVNMKQQSTLQQTCQLKRNQSLSPLRFGMNGRSLESIEDETTDASMEELILRAPNSIDKRLQIIRRSKSDAALGDSDSFSAATSFDDDFDFESESQQILNTSMDANDQDHLLAPSKVSKSQSMFHQTLFGSQNGKRLLSKEEISQSRRLANQNRLASQRARSFETGSLNHDDKDREKSLLPGTLRAEQLVQMRGNSASPDSRQIDRELNTVANLKRFQSFQNFWEDKTKEILDKQKRFSTLSAASNDSGSSPRHQINNVTLASNTDRKLTTTTTLAIVKPETVSPRPTKKKTPKSGNTTKATITTPTTKTSTTPQKTTLISTQKVNPTNQTQKVSTVSLNPTNQTTKTLMKSTTSQVGTVPNGTREKESKSLLDRFSFFKSSAKKNDNRQANDDNPNKNQFIDSNYGKNNGYLDHINKQYNNNNNNIYNPNDHGYVKSHTEYDNNIRAKNHSTVKPEIENDQLYQRVRNIHDDIRQRKLQQKTLPHNVTLPEKHNEQHRPSIQSAKSLDLQYYTLKAKQVPIKLIEPNGPEPGLAKNRFRLIRSGSRDNSIELSSDDNFDALSQVSFASTAIPDCSMQHIQPHSRNNVFHETALHKPMKSTYF